MEEADTHSLFYAYQGTSTVVLDVEFQFAGGAYELRTSALEDGGALPSTAYYALSDATHAIELDWQAASAPGVLDGSLTLWIDGQEREALSGLDNGLQEVDQVRLGAVAGVDAGTGGTYYFDAFDSRRQTYLGPLAGEPRGSFAAVREASGGWSGAGRTWQRRPANGGRALQRRLRTSRRQHGGEWLGGSGGDRRGRRAQRG